MQFPANEFKMNKCQNHDNMIINELKSIFK